MAAIRAGRVSAGVAAGGPFVCGRPSARLGGVTGGLAWPAGGGLKSPVEPDQVLAGAVVVGERAGHREPHRAVKGDGARVDGRGDR
jgi:hypothetical protein